MIADSLDVFAAVCDGASVFRINIRDGSARTGEAAATLIVLSRIGVVLRRVFVKSGFRLVMPFSIAVYFRISLALFAGSGCWRVLHVALYAGATTFMIARVCAVGTVDPTRLHFAGQHES